ncbi:helix-turn-helix domain-containing protein [Nocardioides kribbensis]|uniref:helix-turn-helix domain-containing protein n=1 Tax=Nocardioides kribbensis TaxID=305517 RepID=UPI001879FBBD|nr:helix-turn-helix transcriptional regulator [Nocardioides kribbensis]
MADQVHRPGAEAGARVRAVRRARGLSLAALAEAAGVGKGSLSELETGRRNPTLDTLYALAGPLGVPLAALVEDRDGVAVADPDLETVRLHLLAEADRTVEVWLLRMPPGGRRRSPAHAPGTRERLVVLTGSCRVEPGDDAPLELAAGATAEWAADRPHAYTAGAGGMTGVDVITTPAPATPGG